MMQWGLSQGVLREVWTLVAGDAGQLSTQQFISAIYLMDNAKQVGSSPTQAVIYHFKLIWVCILYSHNDHCA